MAKKKTSTADAVAPASDDQIELAARCIMNVTGCGIVSARRRARHIKPETVAKIAKLEADNKRTEAVSLIYS